jgi:hypothetical protein
MRVETLGEGSAEIAVVGGIHGDEPCGVNAVETLLEERPAVDRPVKCIVANEAAIERDVRYVEEDLNRAFPGDPDGSTHERRLAHHISLEVADCQVLSLHSTQSYGGTFALVNRVGEYERRICPRFSVDTVVETCDFTGGRMFEVVDRLVEVECGFQGSEAASENAILLAREFLAATGALPDYETPHQHGLRVFRLTEPVHKAAAAAYEVYAENFEQVPAGHTYASAGDRSYVAEEDFYPVLMSAYGYEDVFGYAAKQVGTLDAR